MEILNNFASIYCFITFIFGAVFMFIAVCVVAMGKVKEPRNKVHFYIQRGAYGSTTLYMGTPYHRCKIMLAANNKLAKFCIKKDDYKGMKYGELREVFLNLED